MTDTATLYGRVFVTCEIKIITGLHIGGAESSLSIGGVDNVVIRDPLTNRPYIPGSSLKGKMRSQMEKLHGLPQNRSIGRVTIHTCQNPDDYATCAVCHVYGVPGEQGFSTSTRLVVRDVPLTDASADELDRAKTDLPYSEVKWEAAIDRVTSAATPRQMERVPAGAVFGPAELIYSIYEHADISRFRDMVDGMRLLEDDYLGGSGSRGYGKVAFSNVSVYARARKDYSRRLDFRKEPFATLSDLVHQMDALLVWLEKDGVPVEEG